MNEVRVLRRWAYAASAGIVTVCALRVWYVLLPTLAWPLYTAGLIDRNLTFELRYQDTPTAVIIVAQLLAGIVFIVWLSRARRNVSVTAEAARLLWPRFVGLMWVVPIANLFLPGLFVARVAEVSTAAPVERPSRSGLLRLVWAWWSCWAAYDLFGTITSGWLRLRIDTAALAWQVFVAFNVLYLVAGVLAIVVMFKIVSAQAALYAGRLPVADPAHFPTFTVDDVRPVPPVELGGTGIPS